jgi:hypothetical protein
LPAKSSALFEAQHESARRGEARRIREHEVRERRQDV